VRLLLDSSGAELVCALADAEGVILERRYPTGSPESRDIGAAAGLVLGELGPRDLEAVIVGTGPGSFIGTRVAISFANGLGVAGGVPLYGVNSLAAMGAVHGTGRCVVLRDARRGEVYIYGPQGAEPDCRAVSIDELPKQLAALGVSQVVLELPEGLALGRFQPDPRLKPAVAAAGLPCAACPGVPAEGLRRIEASAWQAIYVEPVYLRGFL